MTRFTLDLDSLPMSKKVTLEALLLMCDSNDMERSNLVLGLINLGYLTLKKQPIDTMAALLPRLSKSKLKVRVKLNNEVLITHLNQLESTADKKSCLYGLLYSGLCEFSSTSTLYKNLVSSKSELTVQIEELEKLLFLSGLTQYFEMYQQIIGRGVLTPTLNKSDFKKTVEPVKSNAASQSDDLIKSFEQPVTAQKQSTVIPQSNVTTDDDNRRSANPVIDEPLQEQPASIVDQGFKENNTETAKPKLRQMFKIDGG